MHSTRTITIETGKHLAASQTNTSLSVEEQDNSKINSSERLPYKSINVQQRSKQTSNIGSDSNNNSKAIHVNRYNKKTTTINIDKKLQYQCKEPPENTSLRNDKLDPLSKDKFELEKTARDHKDTYLSELLDEYQSSLNRKDCDNSGCHRFKVLSYRISQTLLERFEEVQRELNRKNIAQPYSKSIMDKGNLLELVSEKEKRILDLEKLVEDQRRLRLQDASQVEDKAAKIKEWVANKLKELENQNKQLRDQNRKQKQTVESLHNKLALLSPVSSPRKTSIAQDQASLLKKLEDTKSDIRRASPVYDSVSQELIQRSLALNNKQITNHYDISAPDIKPPPPPPHQTDKWELKLYNLADENFSHILRASKDDIGQADNLQTMDNFDSCLDYELALQKSSSNQKNCGLKSLVNPTFTTIDGDNVIEEEATNGNTSLPADRLGSSTLFGDKDSCNSSTNRQSNDRSSDNSSNLVTSSKLCRRDIINLEENTEKNSGLFGTPMRSRTGNGDNILRTQSVRRNPAPEKLFDFMMADLTKRGHLIKPGALKNHNRWFVLKNLHLNSYKSEADEAANLTPHTRLKLEPCCQVVPVASTSDSSYPFKLIYPDKTIQLIADSAQARDQWMRILVISISMGDIEPDCLTKLHSTYEGMMSFTRQGHTKKCHAILINRILFFLKSITDPTPIGYLYLKESKIREVTDNHDYDIEEQLELSKQKSQSHQDCSLAIYPKYSMTMDPIYITMGNQQDIDKWYHHMAVASGIDQMYGTPFEQALTKIMVSNSIGSISHDRYVPSASLHLASCCLWQDNNVMLYSDRPIDKPLTSLPNETLRVEAVELFKSILLFTQVPIEPIAIDYHVSLLQNCLSRFLKYPELRNEFYAQLMKQSTYIIHRRQENTWNGNNRSTDLSESQRSSFDSNSTSSSDCHILTDIQLLDSIQRKIKLDTSSRSLSHSATSSHLKHGRNYCNDTANTLQQQTQPPPTKIELVQVMQILAVAVSLNLPRGRMRWWLTDYLRRFADPETHIGKYALYNLKAIERTIENGPRDNVPSRTEIMGILLRNPYDHSSPHSLPVSFSDGSYLVVEADGSTTVDEFMCSMAKHSNIRNSLESDFYLFADDPMATGELHILEPQRKVLDIVGWWEQTLRRHNSGRYQATRVIKMLCKKRLVLRTEKCETQHERLLIVHQINQEIVSQRIPISGTFAVELAAIMAQLTFGDLNDSKNKNDVPDRLKKLSSTFLSKSSQIEEDANVKLVNCWQSLAGRTAQECVRVYLNCIRRLKIADSE